MIKKSTSIHNINADRKLNNIQKVLYLLFNYINSLFPYANLDNKLRILDFSCDDLRMYWARTPSASSPSRKLCDLFWLSLPWGRIREELGEINILDIGCGSGEYGRRLTEWSDNKLSSYTGMDVYKNENWIKLKKEYPVFNFCQHNAADILNHIPEGSNFFMSQSTIEHLDEDLLYFEQVRDYILRYQRSVMQVHLFPSSACLPLYYSHGVRQYTPRTISKISRLFKDFSYTVLFRLGGRECNHLHYNFITKPLLRRKVETPRGIETKEYDRRLFMAIKDDMSRPQKYPAFYALVICSNMGEKIF
ncbi:class I SAM-dependent methyltransferase [Candidatus Omnitrophota bacterium]